VFKALLAVLKQGKRGGKIWTGCIWLRGGTGGGLLWTR